MHRNIPRLLRVPVFVLLLVYSLIVLGIDGHFVDEENKAWHGYFGSDLLKGLLSPTFDALGVATSVLTLISIVPMLIIEFLRQGSVTSWVMIELAWLGFLCVMWLATAADTANFGSCSNSTPFCSQFQTVEAFSFLAWLLLGGYWMVLLVCTIVAFSNGQTRIWITAVTDADFAARGGGGIPQGGVPQGGIPQGGIPQGGVPQGSFPQGSFPQGSFPQGSFPQGSVPQGSFLQGSFPQGSFPQGSVPQGSFPQGSFPQGSVPQGSFPQGSFPQGSFPQGGGVPAPPAQQAMTFPVTGRPASYPPV